MKWIIGLLLVVIAPLNKYDQIGQNNVARKQAEQAYRAGNFAKAAAQLDFLTKKTQQTDKALWLNLGHAYFAQGNYKQARKAYDSYVASESGAPVAVALTQLGVIACAGRDTLQALDAFRRALLIEPDNEPARYNFELLKKQFSGRINQKKRPTQKQKQSTQAQEQEVTKSPRQEQILRRLRTLNMSEEQANQLLNAMRDDDLPLELARRRVGAQPTGASGNRW